MDNYLWTSSLRLFDRAIPLEEASSGHAFVNSVTNEEPTGKDSYVSGQKQVDASGFTMQGVSIRGMLIDALICIKIPLKTLARLIDAR